MIKERRIMNIISNSVLIIITLACILPFLLLIISSFTDDSVIVKYGYSFFPKIWSLYAYDYLWKQAAYLLNAYSITVIVTVIGTAVGLSIASMLAYALSRPDLPYKNLLMFFVVMTLLFNGGLVPTYLVYTQIFHVKNTLWGLIAPSLLMNGFNVLLMRSFFVTNIPVEILEAAQIDGCREMRIFLKIVLPLSMPILATIGLLLAVTYWNDWFNGLIYMTEPNLFSIQNVLNRILLDIQFLQNNASMAKYAEGAMAKIPSTTIRMSIAVVGALPILIAYPFFQKYFVKGITIGVVKG